MWTGPWTPQHHHKPSPIFSWFFPYFIAIFHLALYFPYLEICNGPWLQHHYWNTVLCMWDCNANLTKLVCSCNVWLCLSQCHSLECWSLTFAIMAPMLSNEMRQHIIIWHYKQHLSTSNIQTLAGCSLITIYNILKFHRDYGTVDNPFAGPCGGVCALDKGDVNYLASIIDASPKIYLDKLQQELLLHWNIEVSISTILMLFSSLWSAKRRFHMWPLSGMSSCVQHGKLNMATFPQSILSGWMKLVLMTKQKRRDKRADRCSILFVEHGLLGWMLFWVSGWEWSSWSRSTEGTYYIYIKNSNIVL